MLRQLIHCVKSSGARAFSSDCPRWKTLLWARFTRLIRAHLPTPVRLDGLPGCPNLLVLVHSLHSFLRVFFELELWNFWTSRSRSRSRSLILFLGGGLRLWGPSREEDKMNNKDDSSCHHDKDDSQFPGLRLDLFDILPAVSCFSLTRFHS